MGKNTSDVVSGMGVGMSIVQALVRQVQEQGGTDEDIRYLATPEGEKFLGHVASRLVGHRQEMHAYVTRVGVPKVGKKLMTVTVGGDMSQGDQFEANAVCTPAASAILAVKPLRQRPVELDLYEIPVGELGFAHPAAPERIRVRLSEHGFLPCQADVVRALGAQYPDEERRIFFLRKLFPDELDYPSVLKIKGTPLGGVSVWIRRAETPCNPDEVWVAVWPRPVQQDVGSPEFIF